MEKGYAVIGGQYQSFCYGFAKTLLGAKRLASKHCEYWDNWQGLHTPKIYAAEDVMEVENFYGATYAPVFGAYPVAVKDEATGRWVSGRWED